MLTFLVI